MMENLCVTLATLWVVGLGEKELGILPALDILQLCELAASQHREGPEMGVNQDSAIPGIGNLTHPRPMLVAAGAEGRHCPAGCWGGWCPQIQGKSRHGNTGH